QHNNRTSQKPHCCNAQQRRRSNHCPNLPWQDPPRRRNYQQDHQRRSVLGSWHRQRGRYNCLPCYCPAETGSIVTYYREENRADPCPTNTTATGTTTETSSRIASDPQPIRYPPTFLRLRPDNTTIPRSSSAER